MVYVVAVMQASNSGPLWPQAASGMAQEASLAFASLVGVVLGAINCFLFFPLMQRLAPGLR